MRLSLIAIGKARGSDAALCADYAKRLTCPVAVRELSTGTQKTENAAILSALSSKAFVVALDEKGQELTSRDFAAKMALWQEQGASEIAFVIGGADGLSAEVKARAGFMLSLGRMTWPHRLARVLLLEQIYRAQQINAGHPYHRD